MSSSERPSTRSERFLPQDDEAGDPVPPIVLDRSYREQRDAWLRTFERRFLRALLSAHGGNVRAAARAIDMDRVHLYRLLRRNGLR